MCLVLVLQQATAMKEDPLDSREVARQGSPQREGGPLDMDVWGVIGTRNTNVPSRLPVPARMGVTSCTLHQPHATVLSHLIQPILPSIHNMAGARHPLDLPIPLLI